MSPFRPVGREARWKIVYDLLTQTAVDDLLLYTDLASALGLDSVRDRGTIQAAVHTAAKAHEENDHRAVEAVRNRGYRVVTTEEHLRLASKHQQRSSKSLERGQSKVVHVDLNGVSQEVKTLFHATARAFSLQLEYMSRLDTRQENLEKSLEAVTRESRDRHERSEGEIAELEARMRQLESRVGQTSVGEAPV